MYSTCIFCRTPLGANEVIEHFPVGRRLAFDAERGRLWVVCRKCERWNLTPLEERWEAIEECERRFRATRLRVSTDNVGLARLAEGLELVRIGRPQRPELAAWRYGDQFGRRRRRQILLTVAGSAVIAGVAWGGPMVGLATGGAMNFLNLGFQGYAHFWQRYRTALRVPLTSGQRLEMTLRHVGTAKLVPNTYEAAGWQLVVPHKREMAPGLRAAMWWVGGGLRASPSYETILTGPEAVRAAGLILPKLNQFGGSKGAVGSAVRLIEQAGSAERYFAAAAVTKERRRMKVGDWNALRNLPSAVRLALEMASHEESERQALEGELTLLEQAWRDAEEVAAIADDLLLPSGVEERVRRGVVGEASPPPPLT
ncbi:MAG: hypothetical protein WKG32_18510 [Gemmatimonadaceae bacterium]